MVRVVMLFAFRLLHRPIPRHGQAIRTDDGIEKRARDILEMILAEQFAADLDAHSITDLVDSNAIRVRGLRKKARRKSAQQKRMTSTVETVFSGHWLQSTDRVPSQSIQN